MFNDFLRDYLDIKDYNYDEYCDVAMVGSDEVFNCLQSSYWGLSKCFSERISTVKKPYRTRLHSAIPR